MLNPDTPRQENQWEITSSQLQLPEGQQATGLTRHPGCYISRRAFIKGLLGAAGVLVEKSLSNSAEAKIVSEALLVSSYAARSMRISGNRVFSLVNMPDGTQRIASLDLVGPIDSFRLKDLGPTSIYALDIGTSMDDPSIVLAFGTDSKDGYLGRLEWRTNGGLTKKVYEHGGGRIRSGSIVPGNGGAITYEIDVNDVNISRYFRFDSNLGSFTELNIAPGSPIVRSDTIIRVLAPNLWQNYGLRSAWPGYYRNTFNTDGTFSSIPLREVEVKHLQGELTQFFDDQNIDVVASFSNFYQGEPPNDPNFGVGTAHIDKYNNQGNFFDGVSFQPNTTRPEYASKSVFITTLAFDQRADTSFMATGTQVLIEGIITTIPFIEAFSYSNPRDLTKRQILPRDGDWPTTGAVSPYGGLRLMENSEQRYLLAAIGNSGLLIRRITDGIRLTDPWIKVPFELRPHIYLPFMISNYKNGW